LRLEVKEERKGGKVHLSQGLGLKLERRKKKDDLLIRSGEGRVGKLGPETYVVSEVKKNGEVWTSETDAES